MEAALLQNAEHWLQEMGDAGLRAHGVILCYATVINAFVQKNLAYQAEHLLDEMCTAGLQPLAESYNVTITALRRANDDERAQHWVREMCDAGLTWEQSWCIV